MTGSRFRTSPAHIRGARLLTRMFYEDAAAQGEKQPPPARMIWARKSCRW